MTSPQLSAGVRAHIAALLDGVGQTPLIAAQQRTSAIYRAGGSSDRAITDEAAAQAYAVARLPATYAACVRAFDAVAAVMPGFEPRTHLDLGAGPGTAALAAWAAWDGLERATLVEPNARLRAIGTGVLAAGGVTAAWVDARLGGLTKRAEAADLVTLSYVLSELPEENIGSVLNELRGCFQRVLIIVEPGTPHGFKRILRARQALLALGGEIVAPCPHMALCPLTEADWCHFSVRVQRSAAHKALKGAEVPFEDEPFSYLAVSFDPALARKAIKARVLRPPQVEKGFIDLVVCGADGQRTTQRVLRRDKAAYKAAKASEAGDVMD